MCIGIKVSQRDLCFLTLREARYSRASLESQVLRNLMNSWVSLGYIVSLKPERILILKTKQKDTNKIIFCKWYVVLLMKKLHTSFFSFDFFLLKLAITIYRRVCVYVCVWFSVLNFILWNIIRFLTFHLNNIKVSNILGKWVE